MKSMQCPHCGEEAFSLMQKLRASQLFPEECQSCGGRAYVSMRWFGLTLIIIGLTTFFATSSDNEVQKNIIFVVGFLLSCFSLIIYRWAPLKGQ